MFLFFVPVLFPFRFQFNVSFSLDFSLFYLRPHPISGILKVQYRHYLELLAVLRDLIPGVTTLHFSPRGRRLTAFFVPFQARRRLTHGEGWSLDGSVSSSRRCRLWPGLVQMMLLRSWVRRGE